MAAVSNSALSSVKSQNSPSSISLSISPASRDIHALSESSPSSSLLSRNVDQEYSMTSSSSTPYYSFPAVEARETAVEDSCLVEDTSVVTTGMDAQHPECCENGVATKKQAWNVPSNGINADISTVMGADSWPALSELARASHKGSLTDHLRALSLGSQDLPQLILEGSLSSQTGNNTISPDPNLSSNHAAPSRQRSMRRGGGISNQSSLSQAQPVNDSAVEMAPLNPGKSSSPAGESAKDNMHKDAGQRGPHSGNESHQQRAFRRSNSGPLIRGDGSFHHGATVDVTRNVESRIGITLPVLLVVEGQHPNRELDLGPSYGPQLQTHHLYPPPLYLCDPLSLPLFTTNSHLYFALQGSIQIQLDTCLLFSIRLCTFPRKIFSYLPKFSAR